MINNSDIICSIGRDFTSYLIICHVISAISIPIDIFCGFVILKHSPKQFGAFKWHLFSFHLFAFLTDFALSIGTIPVTFLPIMMGYPGGFFQYFLSTENQLRMVVLFFDYNIGCCVSFFEYRMYKVTQPSSRLHMKPRAHRFWHMLTYTICFAVFVAFMIILDFDSREPKLKLEQKYPCLTDILNHPGLLILDTDQSSVIWSLGILVGVLIFALGAIGVKIAITFSQLQFSMNLSEKSRRMQRKLVVSLIYQVSIPFAIIITPLILCVYICTYKVPGTQIFGNIMFIALSSHGTLSSLAILTMNKPYYNAMKEPLPTRITMSWSTLAPSVTAKNTVNPLRKLALEAVKIPTNPAKKVIRLNLGDPTLSGKLPPSPVVVEAIKESVESHKHDGYAPAVGELAALQAVVDKFSLPEAPFSADDVVLTSGCSHAIQMSIEVLAGSGDNILVPSPGFPIYTTHCKPLGIEDKAYKLDLKNEGLIDLNHLETLIDNKTKAIIINNPGNPSGVVFPKEHLETVLRIAERYRLVIISDEIYGDLVYDDATFYPLASVSPKVPVICCDGLAKRWMVPGWRMGWIIVHDRFGVLTEVKKGLVSLSHRINGSCNIVQGAMPKILKNTPEEYFEYTRQFISGNAKIVSGALKDFPGIEMLKPQGAMYMMIGIDSKLYGDDVTFTHKLIQEESLILFPGTPFLAPGWIRLVITSPEEEILEAVDRIKAFCHRMNPAAAQDQSESSEDSSDSNEDETEN